VGKKKLSATIEDDAHALLVRAAANQGLNVSEMLERAVRLACAGHAPHEVEIDLLDNGGCSVRLSTAGKLFYSYRAARRHVGQGVQVSIAVHAPTLLDVDLIAAGLRHWRSKAVEDLRTGQALRTVFEGLELGFDSLVRRADSEPEWVADVLERCAAAVESVEVATTGELGRRRCPECTQFLTRLRIWQDPRDPPRSREREVTCSVGHVTRSAGPTGAPPESRAAALAVFEEVGPWEGECDEGIRARLEEARREGGSRDVTEQ
jgi:hypothetical protein